MAGHGTTFDQINTTNGFHPLWMLCLLPIYGTVGADSEMALRIVYCLVGVIACTTFWLAYRTVSTYAGRPAAIVAVCSLIGPWFLNPLVNGLETGILLLHLFLILWAVHRYDLLSLHIGGRANALLGLLLGVLFLCRLDSVFIVLAVLAQMGLRWAVGTEGEVGLGTLFRKWLQVGVVALLLVAPYLLWNIMVYGHMVPLSGALKSTFPSISFHPARLTGFHSLFGRIELLFSFVVILWMLVFRPSPDIVGRMRPCLSVGSRSDILLAVWFGCFLHFLNTVLFMEWAAWWWHFSSYVPMTVVLVGVLFGRFHQQFGRSRYITIAAAIGVLAVGMVGLRLDARRRGDHHRPWLEAAMWTRSNLPGDAVVGMTDCGLFGYFCNRRTVNLDGVINGVDYQRALRNHRLGEYLARCAVTHIADYEVLYQDGYYVIKLPARLYKRPGGAIVATASAEMYRSDVPADPSARDSHFAVWDVEDLRVVNDMNELAMHMPPL
ncbi:MAG: hypothetical protein V3W34_01240 [Phycisphaerae bacterium]